MVERIVRITGDRAAEARQAFAVGQVQQLHQPCVVHGSALTAQQESAGGRRLAFLERKPDGGRGASPVPGPHGSNPTACKQATRPSWRILPADEQCGAGPSGVGRVADRLADRLRPVAVGPDRGKRRPGPARRLAAPVAGGASRGASGRPRRCAAVGRGDRASAKSVATTPGRCLSSGSARRPSPSLLRPRYSTMASGPASAASFFKRFVPPFNASNVRPSVSCRPAGHPSCDRAALSVRCLLHAGRRRGNGRSDCASSPAPASVAGSPLMPDQPGVLIHAGEPCGAGRDPPGLWLGPPLPCS